MSTAVNYWELFSVLSNLVLLVAFVTCVQYHLIFGAFITFTECWVSLAYHLCDFSNSCVFAFDTLRYLDFFFAQYFIIYLSLYLVHWNKYWRWLQWILILIGGCVIAILEILLPGELYVQAGIVAVCLGSVLIYWIVYANTVGQGRIPPYEWSNLLIGVSLIAISTTMFSIQNVIPNYYWAAHSVWHAAAGLGFHYWIKIKKKAPKYANVAGKIKT